MGIRTLAMTTATRQQNQGWWGVLWRERSIYIVGRVENIKIKRISSFRCTLLWFKSLKRVQFAGKNKMVKAVYSHYF